MNLGQRGEEIVADMYKANGCVILGRNVRFYGSRQIGELDIVALKGKELIFVEVKTRSSVKYGGPAESIGYLKQTRLVKAVKLFVLKNPLYQGWDYRIDVAEVYIDNSKNRVIILENAIEDH